MIKITLKVDNEDIDITASGIEISYHTFTHEQFNSIIAAYRLLGFYRETTLSLEPKKPSEDEPIAIPEPEIV